MRHSFTLNNVLTTISKHQEMSFSTLLSYFAPNLSCIPGTNRRRDFPLWILLDEAYAIDADSLSIHSAQWNSIVTVEYAIRYRFFYLIYDSLRTYGIPVDEINCAFLLFNTFAWLKSLPPFDVDLTKETTFSKLPRPPAFLRRHPQYNIPPHAFLNACDRLLREMHKESCSIDAAFVSLAHSKKYLFHL